MTPALSSNYLVDKTAAVSNWPRQNIMMRYREAMNNDWALLAAGDKSDAATEHRIQRVLL